LKKEASFTVSIQPKTVFIIRSCKTEIEPKAFSQECESLVGLTKYKKPAKREEAPEKADCLTVVSYLFKKTQALDIPLDWIGNMPRLLVEKGWQIEKIQRRSLKMGDLIFLGKRNNQIDHLAVALSAEKVFHVSWKTKGAAIEKIETLFSRYVQPKEIGLFLSSVDPRSVS